MVQDGKQHGASATHGGHNEEDKDARLAFGDHMIMWKSPNSYDVLYEIKFVTTDVSVIFFSREVQFLKFSPYVIIIVSLLVKLAQIWQAGNHLLRHWRV